MRPRWFAFVWLLISGMGIVPVSAQFEDKTADLSMLPQVPPGFQVRLFASEPLVRQPGAMAFDERGRLFVGMGPQYRNPTPDTPGDSVLLVLDTDGDGQADTTRAFASGLNAVQGLAWHGRDLWIANAPDLTLVRDLDGDDVADEYIKIYTDLGNLEHGLHGLTWGPDGKLYMSKGNSKGLSQPGRYAPKPFRDLWGVTVPDDVPDFPKPSRSTRDKYVRTYQDPADDWGLHGGVLRCDADGSNLEIVSRGFRNPWDIAMDSGFNWLGTDNDQVGGDRIIMPFSGAHFGWNHVWSSHWGTEPHPPTAPVSGPLFEGSGTGIIFGDSPQFPSEFRRVFFINDWLGKTTYVWRPEWDGALMRPASGNWFPFVRGGQALFRPTDLQFGPDGALWILGWSSGYGAEWQDGELTNEGRIFRIVWDEASPPPSIALDRPWSQWTVAELLTEFDACVPVRRTNAQEELLRRMENDGELAAELWARLRGGSATEGQETWLAWTFGRLPPQEVISRDWLEFLAPDSSASLNLQIQAVRIVAYRARQMGLKEPLTTAVQAMIDHPQPRLRFAAILALGETGHTELLPELLTRLGTELDPTIAYAGWQALRLLVSSADLNALLQDSRAGVRRAALLALCETNSCASAQIQALADQDPDESVRELAALWLSKVNQANAPVIRGAALMNADDAASTERRPVNASDQGPALIRATQARSGRPYRVVPGGFQAGAVAYSDREYRLQDVPSELVGADLVQTANDDDGSRGKQWMTAEAIVPVIVWVGIDRRQQSVPKWLVRDFEALPLTAALDEGARFAFYRRQFPAGSVTLGGNTSDGQAGGKGNYIVAVQPLPLSEAKEGMTVESVLLAMPEADPVRGEVWFRHPAAAGCAKCHSLDMTRNGFGPNLGLIGARTNVRHLVESMLEPSKVITQGFNQLQILTDEGTVYSGVLLEESGLSLSLGQSDGRRVDIPKAAIEERQTVPVSAMPAFATSLTAQQVADIAAFLLAFAAEANPSEDPAEPSQTGSDMSSDLGATDTPGFERLEDRVRISLQGQLIVEFVFRDPDILRPYFANAKLPDGSLLTRNHPPIPELDATDHARMHPGIWLGFGDINGEDFWRNRGRMEHVRFVREPQTDGNRLTFATECRLIDATGNAIGTVQHRFGLVPRPVGWLLVWQAEFRADRGPLIFGDQEEMGFAARVATPLTEQNGGSIRNAVGQRTAAGTWGQPATWCDYSGAGSNDGGILLWTGRDNFRESWWHNRDYGVMVANPFGRAAMRQGEPSRVRIDEGNAMTMSFGALLHDNTEVDVEAERAAFDQVVLGLQ